MAKGSPGRKCARIQTEKDIPEAGFCALAGRTKIVINQEKLILFSMNYR